MGEYSPKQGFYLIDGDELVNVETDINYNLKRADARIKPLIQHQAVDPSINSITSSSLPKEVGFKWWKRYSNSIWTYSAVGGAAPIARQDGNNTVEFWTTSGFSYYSGWSNYDTNPNAVGYHSSNGIVRWRGRVRYNAEIPANTVISLITVPQAVVPSEDKMFFVSGGSGSTNFQLFRVRVVGGNTADRLMEVIKYGGNAATTGDRYVNLNAIQYPLVTT